MRSTWPEEKEEQLRTERFRRNRPIIVHSPEAAIGILSSLKSSVFVSVVMHDLAYGGPEEGGWYYDTYDRYETHLMTTTLSLEHISHRLQQFYNEGRPEVSSVLSQGRFYFQIGEVPAQHEPARRPHYE